LGPAANATGSAARWWWRRWYVVLGAVLVVLGIVSLSGEDDSGTTAGRATSPPTTGFSLPTVATLETTTTAPPTTTAEVTVPKLVGMRLVGAEAILADRGLRGAVRYQTTGRHPAGTVISQSRRNGAGVPRDTTITLTVAKAPPSPPSTAPAPPPPTAPAGDCDPSYPGSCLDPDVSDYDCAGGSGNGPEYVEGPIRVRPPDPFDLDRDGDGWGCENG
jgi:PASTA domain